MSIRKHYTKIAEKGAYLLMEAEKTMYNQKTIVEKLNLVGPQIGLASFNKICKEKRVGDKALKIIAVGLQKIITSELGYQFDNETNDFVYKPPEGWKPFVIKETGNKEPEMPSYQQGLTFYEGGRLTISEKVSFMSAAEKNITIIGIRLRQFCEYFSARSDAEFKNHIISLLKKGVDINCYLLNPRAQYTRMYFEDRSTAINKEKNGEERIHEVIEDFKKIKETFDAENYKGKLNIFTYEHIPQNYFLVVDGDTHAAKMQVSHYLYGVLRSKAPVLEIEKKKMKDLFAIYMESLKAICKESVLIV